MQLNHNGMRQVSVYSWAHGIRRRSAGGTVQSIADILSADEVGLKTDGGKWLLAPAFYHVNPVAGVDKALAGFFGQGLG